MQQDRETQTVTVRNVNRAVWRRMRLAALKRGVPLVTLLDEMMREWLAQQEQKEDS